jgi:anaerobic dimethyl sulfoxide reductase subunit A
MAGLLEKIERSGIDRRQFVGLAASVGVVATLGLTGCENKVVETTPESPTLDELDPLTGGEWVPINCLSRGDCRGCYNQAYVVDGVIIRQASDNRHPDDDDNPQYRGCVKGRSARWNTVAADRLKYPVKRKSWQPGGGDNIKGDLRGKDEWEHISWDQAIDYIAAELTRIKETYGSKAFLNVSESQSPILNYLGGCLKAYGGTSQGGIPVIGNLVKGKWAYNTEFQDRIAIRSSKLIVYFGFNTAWSNPQFLYEFSVNKRLSGQKVIIIDPFFSPSVQAIADQWIPIRPSTDGALLEALAYEMITNNLQDQEFLDKYTVGFDAGHMPADAKTNENFKDYILGVYDGQPKTAERAGAICGTDPAVIKELAREMATVKPASIRSTGAPARTYYGNRFAQIFYAVGWMTGNVGVPGGEVAAAATFVFGYKDGQTFVASGSTSNASPANPICTPPSLQNGKYDPSQECGIAYSEVYKSVVTGEYTAPGGEKRACDFKCIYRQGSASYISSRSGAYWSAEAFRKVEFVMIEDIWFTPDAQYADIVLPIKSPLELDYSTVSSIQHQAEYLLVGRKAMESYFESKSDNEAIFALADKLGIPESELTRFSDREDTLKKVMASTVLNENGIDKEPLLTITQADLDELGIEGTPQEGRVPIMDFLKVGAYQVDRHDGDNFMYITDKAFISDPENNPLGTPSGKYEIYCQSLKDYYDTYLFHDIDALPKYKPMVDGYEQSLNEPEFNIQLLTPAHIRSLHSTGASCAPVQELHANDLLMSEYDAKKRGLKKGDWVTLRVAEGGKIARRIKAIPNLVPGTAILGQGNWKDIDSETGVDTGGNANTLVKSHLIGDGFQGFNTSLVAIESYAGKELFPDYKCPRKNPIPE